MTNEAVHAAYLGLAGSRPHAPSVECWCSPTLSFFDVATGGLIYRHRTPYDRPQDTGPQRPAMTVRETAGHHIGRPRLATIPRERILEVVARRQRFGEPIVQDQLANDLAVPRGRLREAIVAHFGTWPDFLAFVDKSDAGASAA